MKIFVKNCLERDVEIKEHNYYRDCILSHIDINNVFFNFDTEREKKSFFERMIKEMFPIANITYDDLMERINNVLDVDND